jgi:predicted nucleotidyltransferase
MPTAPIPVPPAIRPLVERIARDMAPADIWLFGSRARGDAAPDSDWDLLVVLPDDAAEALLDPVRPWALARESGVRADMLVATQGDLAACWGVPNTLGYDLARHGVRLRAA